MSENTGIYKHTITIEVLADTESLDHASLEDLNYQMTFGDFMGRWKVDSTKSLTKEEVIEESYDMGGEPGFFGEEFEE
jgi:hypothetical protein